MAECKFKTPEELGLSQKQFNALVKVSGMLERGEINHAKNIGSQVKITNPFNMNHWAAEAYCGTVHCIGGWADAIEPKARFGERVHHSAKLDRLFYPSNQGDDWSHLTPAQAGRALCHYLKTGDDGHRCWRVALGKEKA